VKIQVLQNEVEVDNDKNSIKAEGIVNNFLKDHFRVNLFIFTDTFRIINILSFNTDL